MELRDETITSITERSSLSSSSPFVAATEANNRGIIFTNVNVLEAALSTV